MKNRFQIKSFITATFFLVVYLNVFITQASCNLPHFFNDITNESSHKKDSHGHHHDNANTSSHHHNEPLNTHNEKDGKKDDDCCNDKTSAFFANQGNLTISSVDFKNTFCTQLVFTNQKKIVCDFPESCIKRTTFYSLPPPKIPDIRVFIQSFII